jgi:hypothetical protein
VTFSVASLSARDHQRHQQIFKEVLKLNSGTFITEKEENRKIGKKLGFFRENISEYVNITSIRAKDRVSFGI